MSSPACYLVEICFNADEFQDMHRLLEKRHKDAGKPILIIVDNARYYHSKETQRFIDQHDGNILLTRHPPFNILRRRNAVKRYTQNGVDPEDPLLAVRDCPLL